MQQAVKLLKVTGNFGFSRYVIRHETWTECVVLGVTSRNIFLV